MYSNEPCTRLSQAEPCQHLCQRLCQRWLPDRSSDDRPESLVVAQAQGPGQDERRRVARHDLPRRCRRGPWQDGPLHEHRRRVDSWRCAARYWHLLLGRTQRIRSCLGLAPRSRHVQEQGISPLSLALTLSILTNSLSLSLSLWTGCQDRCHLGFGLCVRR